jgi:transcriptional regulator GlxA family with amidase domain
MHNKSSTAVFAIPPNVHLLDFGGPAQVFYEAREEGAALELKYVSLHGGHPILTSSCGIELTNLTDYKTISLEKGDIVFVPGMEFKLLEDRTFVTSVGGFLDWMTRAYHNGATICSICTGAFLLAESGMLDGKDCTTHWKYLSQFQERYKRANVLRNRLFVESNNIFTSAGVSSGIDLALYILEVRYGSMFASKIAREIVIYLRREGNDPQLSIFLKYRNHMEDRIHTIQEWMTHHFNEKFTMSQLAERVNTSPRHLTRLFKETTGITISQYVEKLRIEHAVRLLRENNKVEIIASECGFQSTNQLRHLFKKHTGVIPSDYKMS